MNKEVRPITYHGDIAYVPLTRGYVAIIDVVDAHLVAGFNWHAMVGGSGTYAVRNKPGRGKGMIWMHRVIAGEPTEKEVDHRDGNSLNNRRKNLRPATPTENARNHRTRVNNSSGFKGVSLHRKTGKWLAQIAVDGRKVYLGLHEKAEDAHVAYCKANADLHGEFGRVDG